MEEVDRSECSKHGNPLDHKNHQSLSGVPGQILDGKEDDDGRLRQDEQLPQMRCCAFIRLTYDADKQDLQEYDEQSSH
jgi:hypothetical protein